MEHPPSRFLVRQTAGAGLHVIPQVVRIGGCGDGAGHSRVRDDPLEEKLRPGATIEFRRPLRQRLRPDAAEEIAPTKRPIHNDRDLSILRQRQEPLVRLGFHDGIVDLEKIELLTTQRFLHLGCALVLEWVRPM